MINGQYHTERTYNGKPIVIDIAEICGRYEIAVLAKGGTELEMQTVRTIQEARDIYADYLKKCAESDEAYMRGAARRRTRCQSFIP